MEFLTQLWLPILLSAVAVWILSALGWMVVGHHAKDMETLPDEKGFIGAIKSMGIRPGVYGYPNFHANKDSCKNKTKEEKQAMMESPMGFIRVWNPIGMGLNMGVTFVVYLVIGVFIAYLGWAAMKPGESFEQVFKVLGTAGILAYCFSTIAGDVWYQESRRAMVTKFIDGVVFGLATGAIFAWQWPKV